MKKWICASTLVLSLTASAATETTKPVEDVRTFEITPTAPPVPAMKYEFLFRDFNDRLPGDGAVLYMDGILMMTQKDEDNMGDALEAYRAHDVKRFEELSEDAGKSHNTFFDLMELAGRRENCDWNPPYRERGGGTLLPHLVHLRNAGRLLAVRALWQVQHGKTSDAIRTLRVGYELSYHISNEPTLVSNLVALNIEAGLNDAANELMNRTDAPNLYWALVDLPLRKPSFRIDFERLGSASYTIAATAGLKVNQELSGAQWRTTLDALDKMFSPDQKQADDPVAGTSAEIMQRAKHEYAEAHHFSDDQAAKIDPMEIICWYYFEQYKIAYDDMYKLQGLAYPAMLTATAKYDVQVADLRKAQPANPFFKWLPTVRKAVITFARSDRQVAAFTAVEAIRSYATAHAGQLPAKLEDVSDNPVPVNPSTNKEFDYHIQDGVATLEDMNPEMPLKYTIKIRK